MRALLVVAAALLFAVALRLAPSSGTMPPGVVLRDFEAYWAAGRASLSGGSPYARVDLWAVERTIPGVDPSRDELLPFVSPPLVLPLFMALAELPYDRASVRWLMLLAAACALGVAAAFATAGWRPADSAVAALVALTFSPLTATLALGQLAGLAFAALAVAVYALGRYPGAVALACSAAQPNLAIVALAGIRRSTIKTYALAAALLAALAAATYRYPAGGLSGYLTMLAHHAAAERGDAIQFSLYALLTPLGGAAQTAVAAAAVAVCIIVTFLVARGTSAQRSVAFACALLPFATPFFHHQDLIVVLIPAAFALTAWRARGSLLGALGTAIVAVDWLSLAQQPAARWEDLALAAGGACAIAALRPSRRALWLAVPTAAALCAAPLAAAHPLPLWPFALPPGFHVPPGLGASAVWGREQAAAGLMRVQPLWTALRAIPLFGCALIAAALALEGACHQRPVRCPPSS